MPNVPRRLWRHTSNDECAKMYRRLTESFPVKSACPLFDLILQGVPNIFFPHFQVSPNINQNSIAIFMHSFMAFIQLKIIHTIVYLENAWNSKQMITEAKLDSARLR